MIIVRGSNFVFIMHFFSPQILLKFQVQFGKSNIIPVGFWIESTPTRTVYQYTITEKIVGDRKVIQLPFLITKGRLGMPLITHSDNPLTNLGHVWVTFVLERKRRAIEIKPWLVLYLMSQFLWIICSCTLWGFIQLELTIMRLLCKSQVFFHSICHGQKWQGNWHTYDTSFLLMLLN